MVRHQCDLVDLIYGVNGRDVDAGALDDIYQVIHVAVLSHVYIRIMAPVLRTHCLHSCI